jgi:hypothetical protein
LEDTSRKACISSTGLLYSPLTPDVKMGSLSDLFGLRRGELMNDPDRDKAMLKMVKFDIAELESGASR